MVFLDTCVWIELMAVSTPKEQSEIERAQRVTTMFSKFQSEGEEIVTCSEQLMEIISAVQKVKQKEYNRNQRKKTASGVGNIKEFRKTTEFINVQNLCKSIIRDVLVFSKIDENAEYDINTVLEQMSDIDLNDSIYYQLCLKKGIKLYTIDNDFNNICSDSSIVNVI